MLLYLLADTLQPFFRRAACSFELRASVAPQNAHIVQLAGQHRLNVSRRHTLMGCIIKFHYELTDQPSEPNSERPKVSEGEGERYSGSYEKILSR